MKTNPFFIKNETRTRFFKDHTCTILHREDGPAIEWLDGTKHWVLNGKRHREDGPAIEYPDGHKEWFVNGIRHRVDGPAIEYSSGSKSWYVDGKLHRLDGPAFEYDNGIKEWWVNGKNYSEQEYDKEILKMKPKTFCKKDEYGTTSYYKDKSCSIFHREDGPAIEFANGHKEWIVNGNLHREDGPACEHADGTKIWYINGKYHRVDGPAIECSNGRKEWYLNGERHREDGPAIESVNGDKIWYLNGVYFRSEKIFKKAVENLKQKTIKNNPTNNNNEIKMTTEKPSVTSMLKTSMIEGAKRNGVRTLTKASLVGVQTAIVKSAPAGPNTDAIIAFMATPAAEILIKGIVGFAIPHIPQLQDHKLAQLLGGECRNQTAEDAQREVFDKVMEFIVPAVMGSLAELQNSPQMRILLDETNKEEVSVPSQEEEVVSKKSSAAL